MHAHPHNLTHTATIMALVCHIAQRTGTTMIDTTPRGGNCNDQAVIIIYDSVPLGHLMGMRGDWGPVQKEVPASRRWVYRCRARALGLSGMWHTSAISVAVCVRSRGCACIPMCAFACVLVIDVRVTVYVLDRQTNARAAD